MSDDQAREMRPETTSEHIARDMREGRFPEQSERQMVPVLASLPHEIQVWRSMDALDHTGTWSTTRYPAEAVTYISKADAQAAVALVVGRAAGIATRHWEGEPEDTIAMEADIRSLAPADGLAAVQALRAEARESAMQALASLGQAQEAYEAQLKAEAERDRLAAELAASRAREARRSFPILKGEGAKIDYQLVSDHAEQARSNHYQSVERLAERGGLSWCELYAVLHNRKWEKIDDNEAMIACRALEARYLAALASTPPDTWHERRTMLPDGDARKGEG